MEEQKTLIYRECPSCHKPAAGNYCMHCGEKIEHEVITLRYLLTHIPDLFDLERGLIHTMWSLFRSPGRELRRYFMGNRSKHYKPFKYVFFLGAISGVLNIFVLDFDQNDPLWGDLSHNPEMKAIAEFTNNWFAILLMLIFPVIALITWRIFIKRPYTYGEHLVAHAYLIGQGIIVDLITTPLRMLKDDSIYTTVNAITQISFLLYVVYFYYDWIFGKRTMSGLIKSIGVTLLVYFVLFLLLYTFGPTLFYTKNAVGNIF